MEIKERKLAGTFEVNLQPRSDERGFFMRTYDFDIFEKNGINKKWVQENHSKSMKSGIIRGLHFQLPPFSETKLVRCISGAVLDVFVDLRLDSKTFGQWDSIEISADNKNMILIPRGFAHGFLTLTEESEVLYKVDNFYSQEHERGLIWNDENLKIDWGITEPILSDKDRRNMSFEEFVNGYKGIRV